MSYMHIQFKLFLCLFTLAPTLCYRALQEPSRFAVENSTRSMFHDARPSQTEVTFFVTLYVVSSGAAFNDNVLANTETKNKESHFPPWKHAMLDPTLTSKGVEASIHAKDATLMSLPSAGTTSDARMLRSIAIVASVLRRAQQTALLQVLPRWLKECESSDSDISCNDETFWYPEKGKVEIVPFLKEAGETADDIPEYYVTYRGHKHAEEFSYPVDKCVGDSAVYSGSYDTSSLKFDAVESGAFESSLTKFVEEFLPKDLLPKMLPKLRDSTAKDYQGDMVAIALVTHPSTIATDSKYGGIFREAWEKANRDGHSHFNRALKTVLSVNWKSGHYTVESAIKGRIAYGGTNQADSPLDLTAPETEWIRESVAKVAEQT